MKNVSIFKYLGARVHQAESSTGWTEINYRIDSAKAQFAQKKNLFINHDISIKTRTKFLNSYIRSRLTYSCQNWALTKVQLNKLDSVYATFLRKMIRGGYSRQPSSNDSINYKFRYTNESLYKICDTSQVSIFLKKRQKQYLAHLIRQSDTSITKKTTVQC